MTSPRDTARRRVRTIPRVGRGVNLTLRFLATTIIALTERTMIRREVPLLLGVSGMPVSRIIRAVAAHVQIIIRSF